MARKGKGYQGRVVKLTESEIEVRFLECLTLIEELCSLIDEGRFRFTFALAAEIHKLVTSVGYPRHRLRSVAFPSPNTEDSRHNLAAYFRLAHIHFSGTRKIVEFVPLLSFDGVPWKLLNFHDWWEERIFRESAGERPGSIPIGGAYAKPFEEREWMNRRQLIQTLRDKFGAHQEVEFPLIIREMDGVDIWGDFEHEDDVTGEVISTREGTLPQGAGHMTAATRQIAHELLVALGRASPPPLPIYEDVGINKRPELRFSY